MPSRILREGILTSERVERLSQGAELFYRRVMSVVDDFGRYYAKPELLRAACFPLRVDRVTNKEVNAWLGECVQAGLIKIHKTRKGEVIELIDFKQQVRAQRSKHPLDSEKH